MTACSFRSEGNSLPKIPDIEEAFEKPEKNELSDGSVLSADNMYTDSFIGYQIMIPEFKESSENYITGSRHTDFYFEKMEYGNTIYRILVGAYFFAPQLPDGEGKTDLTKIKSSEDILDNMVHKIGDSYEMLYDVQEYSKDLEESVDVAGFKATKWKGRISFSYDESINFESVPYVAYGFLGSDGRPYLFAAYNAQEQESPEYTELMEEVLDATVQTFIENPLPAEYRLDEYRVYLSTSGTWG